MVSFLLIEKMVITLLYLYLGANVIIAVTTFFHCNHTKKFHGWHLQRENKFVCDKDENRNGNGVFRPECINKTKIPINLSFIRLFLKDKLTIPSESDYNTKII